MKKVLLALSILLLAGVGYYLSQRSQDVGNPKESTSVDLPINAIPVAERPYLTLTPDASGRNLTLMADNAPTSGIMEYELVYQSAEKQEGVFGRLDLESEKQPIEKSLLLGSKSGGGKITYHEGITGGSLAVTFNEHKLKEQFNFLRFDPSDPTISSSDVHFSATFAKNALSKDSVIIVMKTFGLPSPLNTEGSLLSGPYSYFAPSSVKGDVQISLKLPSGEHQDSEVYTYVDGQWELFETSLIDGKLQGTASANQSIFVVTAK